MADNSKTPVCMISGLPVLHGESVLAIALSDPCDDGDGPDPNSWKFYPHGAFHPVLPAVCGHFGEDGAFYPEPDALPLARALAGAGQEPPSFDDPGRFAIVRHDVFSAIMATPITNGYGEDPSIGGNRASSTSRTREWASSTLAAALSSADPDRALGSMRVSMGMSASPPMGDFATTVAEICSGGGRFSGGGRELCETAIKIAMTQHAPELPSLCISFALGVLDSVAMTAVLGVLRGRWAPSIAANPAAALASASLSHSACLYMARLDIEESARENGIGECWFEHVTDGAVEAMLSAESLEASVPRASRNLSKGI